jgi:Radical SAM ThiC family
VTQGSQRPQGFSYVAISELSAETREFRFWRKAAAPIQNLAELKRLEDLAGERLPEVIEHQAKQGVEYMTIHASVRLEQLLL